MKVRSDRRHRFSVPPEELWAAMASVDRFQRWWPWLRRFDAASLSAGETWTATVQPPLPYRLTFALHLTEVDAPRSAAVEVTGDIEGAARLEVSPIESGSELHFVSELAPRNPALRAVAGVAAPLVRFGHDWVLDAGLRQFRSRALP